MPTETEVAALQREWESQGHSPEEIGKRIAAIVEREDAQAVLQADEPITDEPKVEQLPPPSDDWPLCPVCGGNGRIPPQLHPSKKHMTCPGCEGLGEVLTGSLKADYATYQCDDCNGNGYVYIADYQAQDGAPANEYERRW